MASGAADGLHGLRRARDLSTLLACLAHHLLLLLTQLLHQVVGLVHQVIRVGLPRLHLTG